MGYLAPVSTWHPATTRGPARSVGIARNSSPSLAGTTKQTTKD